MGPVAVGAVLERCDERDGGGGSGLARAGVRRGTRRAGRTPESSQAVDLPTREGQPGIPCTEFGEQCDGFRLAGVTGRSVRASAGAERQRCDEAGFALRGRGPDGVSSAAGGTAVAEALISGCFVRGEGNEVASSTHGGAGFGEARELSDVRVVGTGEFGEAVDVGRGDEATTRAPEGRGPRGLRR